MTPEERERQRRIMLARTGPLSSGVSPGGVAPWNQMPISDEAWYTLPPSLTGGMLSAEDYRSMVDRRRTGQDRRVLDYLSSGRLPTQAEISAAPVSTLPAQTDTTAAPVDTTVRPAVSDVERPVATDSGIPSIPSVTGGLSTAAQGRLQARKDKWGGWMDAHAFATGATSRRKSFESGLGNIFAAPKDPLVRNFDVTGPDGVIYTIPHQFDRTKREWVPLEGAGARKFQEKPADVKMFNIKDKIVPHRWDYDLDKWIPMEGMEAPRWRDDPTIQKFEEGGNFVWKQWNRGTKTWEKIPDMPDTPRWQDKDPLIKEFKEGDKIVYKSFNRKTGQWERTQEKDAPRWQKKDPDIKVFQVGDRTAPYKLNRETGTYEPIEGLGGPKWEAPSKVTTFNEWVRLEEEARGAPLDAAERADAYKRFVLIDQQVVRGFSASDQSKFMQDQRSFQTSSSLIERMLGQLASRDVLTGMAGGFVSGWENVTDQVLQVARALGARSFRTLPNGKQVEVDEAEMMSADLYDWGKADLGDALKSNITQLAYSLARAVDPSGRLSDFDVQTQIDRISGSYQSKSSMASRLKEINNQLVSAMEKSWKTAKDNDMPGTQIGEFQDYLASVGMGGRLLERQVTDYNGVKWNSVGRYITVTNAEGKKERKFRTIAKWGISN